MCSLQLSVVLDVVAEGTVGLRLVYVAVGCRASHNLVVGRVEHHGTLVLGLVDAESVVLIADAE